MISISGGKPSKSRTLAESAAAALLEADPAVSIDWLDLADTPLPPFSGPETWSHESVVAAREKISAAEALILATPIYNYTFPSSAKALIELTGQAWEGKLAAFLCTAGGSHSFMAPLGFANSLMLDFRCLILPRFVYATGDAFSPTGELASADIHDRLKAFARELLKLGPALR